MVGIRSILSTIFVVFLVGEAWEEDNPSSRAGGIGEEYVRVQIYLYR